MDVSSLYGYDQGLMGGFITETSFLGEFPQIAVLFNPGNLHKAQLLGFTVAIWNLGCMVSALFAIFIGDRLGRKKMIYLGLGLLLIGEIVQCTSFSWGQLVAGRLIAGFGNGFNCATVPAWQAECTKAHRRGTLLMISAGVCIAAGLAFAYWMDFAFAWLDPDSAAWRVPIALQMVCILVAGAVMVSMPESPRWLILSGREDEALRVLSALNDLEPNNHEIHQEFLQIKDAVIEMAKASVSRVFKRGDYRDGHRVFLAVLLQFFQQIGGMLGSYRRQTCKAMVLIVVKVSTSLHNTLHRCTANNGSGRRGMLDCSRLALAQSSSWPPSSLSTASIDYGAGDSSCCLARQACSFR